MSAGLTRQALRKQPWAFAGPFVTQCLAAALVSGALGASSSMSGARLDPAARQALTESGIPEMAVLFVVVSVYLTALIVGLTMTSSIARQGRDIALVRAVGATPGGYAARWRPRPPRWRCRRPCSGCRSVPCSPAPGWRGSPDTGRSHPA